MALAYGSGAASGAAALGAHGAGRAIVLGDEDRPAITYAPAAVAAARDGGLALLAAATPNGRDLAAALVGLLDLPAFGPVRAARVVDGTLETEQATLQGSVITTARPIDGAPTPAVVLVLANTFTLAEGGSGTAEVDEAPAAAESALSSAAVAERHEAEAKVVNLEEASVIVAGGRGVAGEEGFGPLRDLAAALGGAVGASRAAADAGWIPVPAPDRPDRQGRQAVALHRRRHQRRHPAPGRACRRRSTWSPSTGSRRADRRVRRPVRGRGSVPDHARR